MTSCYGMSRIFFRFWTFFFHTDILGVTQNIATLLGSQVIRDCMNLMISPHPNTSESFCAEKLVTLLFCPLYTDLVTCINTIF